MQFSWRHVEIFVGLAVGVTAVLAVVLEAAGEDVQLAVAVAAIAVLVASYASIGLLAVRLFRGRSAEDEEAGRRALRRRTRVHFPILLATPLVILAAHPWGMASVAVAFGILGVGQALFLHVMLVVGFILKRRARTTPSQ